MDSITLINLLICTFSTFNAVSSIENLNSDTNDTDINLENLKFVSVLFRHGNRAPDTIELKRFPKDPNYYNTFYPEGVGGLTNEGKRKEFKLGELLRNRYDNFLGDEYLPESILARSTDYARTKMSLQLVLAGLYPPRERQVWNESFPWQPIPTTYVPSQSDWLMVPHECPEYLAERKAAEEMPEVQSKIESFRGFMNNLAELTGKIISSPLDMYYLYHLFTAETAMNLTLPNWVKDVFPTGRLLDGILLEYEIFSYTESMRRLNGGKLLHHMIEEIRKVENGSMHKNRRINLYSGHETNVAAILQTLGIFTPPHVPAYSSAVIVELIEGEGEDYVRILYYRGISESLELQKIPGCDYICPLERFIYLLKDVTPAQNELICDKRQFQEEEEDEL